MKFKDWKKKIQKDWTLYDWIEYWWIGIVDEIEFRINQLKK